MINRNLSCSCPTCSAPRGELCRNPTRAQIDRRLPPGEVWTGSNRRVHSSRVGQVEYLQALRAALGV